MLEFLNMDGYGIFIWPSYIFAFSLISYLYFRSVKQLKKLEKEFEEILKIGDIIYVKKIKNI